MLACGQVLLHTSIHKEKYLADEIFQSSKTRKFVFTIDILMTFLWLFKLVLI